MEGLAEYATEEMNTIDEMVLRDAVLTDQLLPLEVMDASWDYLPNPFLAYKQSHSLMEFIAERHGPEKDEPHTASVGQSDRHGQTAEATHRFRHEDPR